MGNDNGIGFGFGIPDRHYFKYQTELIKMKSPFNIIVPVWKNMPAPDIYHIISYEHTIEDTHT